MTASNTLALFKTPVARGDFSPADSTFPPRSNPLGRKPASSQKFPAPLTETLPNMEGTLLLGLAALAIPSVGYCLLQLSHLMSGNLLENAIRAFVP